jgi:hypothetical protein
MSSTDNAEEFPIKPRSRCQHVDRPRAEFYMSTVAFYNVDLFLATKPVAFYTKEEVKHFHCGDMLTVCAFYLSPVIVDCVDDYDQFIFLKFLHVAGFAGT